MHSLPTSTEGFMKQIRTIHFALIAGVILLLAVSLYLNISESLQMQYDTEFSNSLFLVTAGLTVIMLPAGYFVFKKRCSAIDRSLEPEEMLQLYKSAYIVKMGMIETPAFFSIIVLLLTGNYWLLVQIIAVLLVMLINRPSAENIAKETGIDSAST